MAENIPVGNSRNGPAPESAKAGQPAGPSNTRRLLEGCTGQPPAQGVAKPSPPPLPPPKKG